MKTKIIFSILVGICFILTAQESFAQCNTTITVASYTLKITDASCTTCSYDVQERVVNSSGTCFSKWLDLGLYTASTWTIPEEAFSDCKNPPVPNTLTYWLVVKVTRTSDNAIEYTYSTGEYPDLNLRIHPGTLEVDF